MNYYKQGLGTVIGAEPSPKKEGSLLVLVGIMVGITTAIYGLSPGARSYYKTGKLPG